MKTKFSHVNIISRDWRMLADFYIRVFDCKPMLPERDLMGRWVDQLSGLSDVTIRGIHLQLPGYEADGPTLEIFSYNDMKKLLVKRSIGWVSDTSLLAWMMYRRGCNV